MIVQFHQNVKGGFKRGERYTVVTNDDRGTVLSSCTDGEIKPLPFQHPDRFEVYQQSELSLSVGDKIRFSLSDTEVHIAACAWHDVCQK